jgi:hypothetical protein
MERRRVLSATAVAAIRRLSTTERTRADISGCVFRLYLPQMNYAKYCGPQRLVHALASNELPPLGAHLITPWLGYTHHGIYAGDGKVIQYGALKYDIIRKPVEEVTLEDFAQGRPIFVVTHAQARFEAEQAISRARSRLGEKHYRLLTNNCEHFVEWCLHDEHRSFEVETALTFPSWFGERVVAALMRFVHSEPRSRTPAPARVENPSRNSRS